jgi:L-amino acid N-acyltransferase YncA
VEIRLATPADGDGIAAVYAPYVTGTAISFEVDPPDATEMRRRVAATLPNHPWVVAGEGDAVIGYAYGHPFAERVAYRWSVETSVYVDPTCHRRGAGRALYSALFAILTLQGYTQAFAGVALPNQASVGMHESMGFVAAGVYRDVGWKMGAWHDVGWWQRPIGGGNPHPSPPVTLTDLDPADLRAALS